LKVDCWFIENILIYLIISAPDSISICL